MKGEAFLRELPELFDGFPDAETPPGLARPNNLALLNLAARCVAPDETYVEVGAFRGSSLIGALIDNDGVDFLAIDDFSHSGASRDELERNLARFGFDGRVTIIEGDA